VRVAPAATGRSTRPQIALIADNGMAAPCCYGRRSLQASKAGHRMGRFNEVDWTRLSEIGQAFGIVSVIISAVALVAVSFSLRIQRRQARVAQLEAVVALRIQLLQHAIKKPRYLKIWGFDTPGERAPETAYISMVFAYLKMAFTLELLTELELRHYCKTAFAEPSVGRFWKSARHVYLNDASTPKGHLFAHIMDGEFRASLPDLPIQPDTRTGRRPRAWVAAGLALAVGVAATVAVNRRGRRT
jgi:hypothetical protein